MNTFFFCGIEWQVKNNIVDWVPIRTIYAGEGSHIQPWHHTVNFLRMVWQTRRSIQSLKRE
jgi:hypothetical protein